MLSKAALCLLGLVFFDGFLQKRILKLLSVKAAAAVDTGEGATFLVCRGLFHRWKRHPDAALFLFGFVDQLSIGSFHLFGQVHFSEIWLQFGWRWSFSV